MSDAVPQMQVADLLQRLRRRQRECRIELEEITTAITLIERVMAQDAIAEPTADESVSTLEQVPVAQVVRHWTPAKSIARGRTSDASRRSDMAWRQEAVRILEGARTSKQSELATGPTQFDALIQLARENGGVIRVADARNYFIRHGLTRSSPRNVYTNIHHQLRRSELFEPVGPGEFRLVPRSPMAAESTQPDEDSPELVAGMRGREDMDEQDELVDRLAKAGWHLGGKVSYPGGAVELKLRPAPDTSGEPVRSIFGSDIDDAIRKELARLEAEDTAREP
jgi:hypothetical protein